MPIGWCSPAQTPAPVTMHSVLPIVIHGKQCNAVSELLQQLCNLHLELKKCCKCYLSTGHADLLSFECHINSRFDEQVLC